MTTHDGTDRDLARAQAEHWRRLARERSATLEAMRRRPIVRVAMAVDRRAARARQALARPWVRSVARLRRLLVLVAGWARLPGRRRRRARLSAVVESLRPAPDRVRRVTVVAVGGRAEGHVEPTGVAAEVVEVDGARSRRDHGARSPTVAAVRRAVESAATDLVCILPATSRPLDPGYLARLVDAVEAGAVAATAQVVHPARPARRATAHDLRVRTAGYEVRPGRGGVPELRAREAGSEPSVGGPPVAVAAGSAAALVVSRAAHRAAGGLPPVEDLEVAVVELCLRSVAAGGRVVCVPDALVADDRPVETRRALRRPIAEGTSAWRALVERSGPALRRAAPGAWGPTPSFALTVAAPSAKVAPRWGDWHLASALADGLRRLGHLALVSPRSDADATAVRTCDVHLVVRGLARVRRSPGQHHVLWVISHPEALEDDELDEADLVLVASGRLAGALRRRTATPVEVLLQATDHHRFHPVPPDPRHAHPVTVVAKTRGVRRRAVVDALEAGLRPAIYGGGWESIVDPDLVVAEHVANEDLPVVYSSAGVVLNDHWDAMRTWGLVSNRVFDVLACGTPIVSDHVPELAELFGDAVVTYREPSDLRARVDALLADPASARARAARGRELVLGAHTFDHRARRLLELLEVHGLGAPGG